MPNALLPPFDICVKSSQTAVREALAGLLDGLKPLELAVEEEGTVELVVAEALNNIVEHAYPENTQPGSIEIECVHKSDGLYLRIKDEGAAMPDGQIPIGMCPDVNVDMQDLPEGGFGWFLIKDLAKDVSYVRDGAENCLRMRLAVGLMT